MGGDGKSWNTGYGELGEASLGKSRQVGGDGTSWNTGYGELGYASLGKSRQVGGDGKSIQAMGSVRQISFHILVRHQLGK